MKNRQTVFTIISGIVIFSNVVFAQNKLAEMPAADRAKMQTTRMTSSLQLDSTQAAAVGRVNLKYAEKMDPVIKGSGGRMSKFKAFKEINNQKEKDLKAILSKEQFAHFKEQQEEMKKEIRDRKR